MYDNFYMGRLKEIFNKYKNIIMCAAVILTSCAGLFFSYLYGTSNQSVSLYANLMVLDDKTKKQDINFLNGYFELNNEFDPAYAYDKNIAIQYKTIYKQRYFNSYLLATSGTAPKQFSSSLYYYSTKTKIDDLNNYSVAMVRNYWDGAYMESIGLPLFYITTSSTKNRINAYKAKKPDMDFGSYISSTQAYEIAIKSGLLKYGENDANKIRTAFYSIIEDDNDYYLTLSYGEKPYKFAIQNIYIDSNFDYLLNDDQKSVSPTNYGDYYKSFSCWNKNTIFTWAPDIFKTGSTLYFDIRGSYNNINLFIANILGENYPLDGSTIHFRTQTENLDEISKSVDKACTPYGKKNGNIIYLILAVIFFELLIILHVNVVSIKCKNKALSILKFILPVIPFVALWTILQIATLSSSTLLFVYTYFNYLGNTISIVFLLLIVISGIIWRAFDDEDEKVI